MNTNPCSRFSWSCSPGPTTALCGVLSAPRSSPDAVVGSILREVGNYYGVPAATIAAHDRRRAVVHARMVAMYLCSNRLGLSLSDIGQRFGGFDHSTVHAAIRKATRLAGTRDFARALEAIEARLPGAREVEE